VVFLHDFSTEMMAELIRDGLVNSPPHPTPCMPSRSARASPSTPDIAFLARISANRTWPWGPDCVAAQSEQWFCWIGRRRIISGSAEDRGNSRHRND